MVEINEQSSDDNRPSDVAGTAGGRSYSENSVGERIVAVVKEKKIDALLWLLRAVTLVFGFLYVVPINVNQFSCYQRALIAGAATHLLRLHQRLGAFQFSLHFIKQMFVEDACHYLFFCVMFLGIHPITMALMPVYLFALLHWTSFTIQLLNVANLSNTYFARVLNRLVEQYSQSCLQVIAYCEIFLMPLVVFMIFSGKSNLLIPFVYYRFLTLRYMSRRNPSTRQAFQEMRLALEQTVSRPGCPGALRSLAFGLINSVNRLAPRTATASG